MSYIKLQSSDGEVFTVELKIANQLNTIKTMLEGKHTATTQFFRKN